MKMLDAAADLCTDPMIPKAEVQQFKVFMRTERGKTLFMLKTAPPNKQRQLLMVSAHQYRSLSAAKEAIMALHMLHNAGVSKEDLKRVKASFQCAR